MPSDAVALPSPPDIPPWKDKRPYPVGGNMHSNGVTRPASYQNGTRPQPRPMFPNIKDLQDQAALLNVNDATPVSTPLRPSRGQLLTCAGRSPLDNGYPSD